MYLLHQLTRNAALDPLRSACAFSALALLCLTQAPKALASEETSTQNATRSWVQEQLAMQPPSTQAGLRVEVIVGKLDMRLQLAPCAKVETFLPPGTRLWGRSRVGLRCTDDAVRWQVFLPIRIKAIGPAWVLRYTLPANSVLSEQDAVLQDVDWAESTSPVLAQASDWAGKSLARTSLSGETISLAMVRAQPVFASGARVKLVAQGSGFNISSAGYALGAGVPGQNVSVRLESGRIVSGVVHSDGVVTLGL
ncbi:MAG: flagellar basal body P-ring formation chaperone FlgA [Polaromonas sp.]